MTSLLALQRMFAACLDGSADSGLKARFHDLVAVGEGLSPQDRVTVYRGSSRQARLRTLELVFPVCLAILGQRCFRGLSSVYLDQTPSRSGDLNLYGDVFPGFLARRIRTSEELARLPYLGDLARLEWHWHAVYYAPEDPSFDMEGFAQASSGAGAEAIRFRLSAGLRLLASDYPVHEIWRRHREGGDTDRIAVGEGDRLVIRRNGVSASVEAVREPLFALLSAIAGGNPLGVLATDKLDLDPLPGLIAAGWIVGFEAAGN